MAPEPALFLAVGKIKENTRFRSLSTFGKGDCSLVTPFPCSESCDSDS